MTDLLLILLIATILIVFYCTQRTLLEILRMLRLTHTKLWNVSLFLKPEVEREEHRSGVTRMR